MNGLKKCKIPGVPPHKQIELLTKGRKYLPVKHQYVTSPRINNKSQENPRLSKKKEKNRGNIKETVKAKVKGESRIKKKTNGNYTVGK